jgi:hypothetical protein
MSNSGGAFAPISSNASRFVAAFGACVFSACGGDDAAVPDEATNGEESSASANGDTAVGESGDGSTDVADDAADDTVGSSVCDELEFDNLVDEASCPYVQGEGVEPTPAGEIELCRRYFVDLVGRVPTLDEVAATCSGRTPEEIVDELMAGDGYVQLGRRVWADELRMTSQISYYEYIEQADALVQDLYRGDILLPEFAIEIATHPAFTSRFDGQDLVGYNFQMFLGRDAAPHERLGLHGLWRSWIPGEAVHPDYYFPYLVQRVDTTLCAYLPALCHTELWGHHSVVIPQPFPASEDYELNVLDLAELGDDEWAELQTPGVLITQQPTFYETAADKALERYLGYDAGVQMPLVQQALVTLANDTAGDVRALEREILTSQLYTMAAAAPDPDGTPADEGTPDYWHGPTKHMTAEAWLDSLELLTGFELGSCDPRFPEPLAGEPYPGAPFEEYRFHPNEFPKDPAYPASANWPNFLYAALAWRIGGCPNQVAQTRFTGTGVMISLAHAQNLQLNCGYMAPDAPLLPVSFSAGATDAEALREIATHMIDVVSLGEPPAGIDAAIDDAVDGCLADDDCDAELFAIQTCDALMQSAPFLFY